MQGAKNAREKKIINIVTDYSSWLSEPKMSGSKIIKVEIFFAINRSTSLKNLIQSQLAFLWRERMRVEIKRTSEENTNRLGIVVEPVVERANLEWHEQAFKELTKLDMGDIKLKKDIACEGDEQ